MDNIDGIDRGQLLMWIAVGIVVVVNVGIHIIGYFAQKRRRRIDGAREK